MEAVHAYLSAATAVLLGATAAGAFTSYLNHLSTKNENIKDYLADLDVIEKLCRGYWLFEGCPKNDSARLEAIGHELRARVQSTASYETLSRSILGKRYKTFEELDVRLFMTATGGTFQTSSFAPSPQTYGEVLEIITEMRRLLRQQRISLFWAG